MSTETTQDLAAKSGLTVASTPRPEPVPKVPRWVSFYHEVEVEMSAGDLHEKGWHHDNECPAGPRRRQWDHAADGPHLGIPLEAALTALHHQAHGSGSITLCMAEPCASLSLDQLRGAA